MITRKFKKFLKRGKFNSSNNFDTNKIICFGCNKPGHYKKYCPLQKSRSKFSNNFNGFKKSKHEHLKDKKKKALAITWDDSDLSSSDEENEQEEHQANMCFMGLENKEEVSHLNEELHDAFNELFLKFKNLNSSYKILKIENERLSKIMISPHDSEISILKEANHDLFNENRLLTNNNHILKSEIESLNSRISKLDFDISSLRTKHDVISNNVSKFNRGKENLDNLLSYQLSSNNKQGLGYKSIGNVVASTSHMIKNKSTLLYSRFVKSNTRSDDMNVCSNSISLHDRSSSKKINVKSNFIWIPKTISKFDKVKYVNDYMISVCNSNDYISHNLGKPNAYWVWFPKN